MSGDEGFLARWSRRKQEARAPARETEPASDRASPPFAPSAAAPQPAEPKPTSVPDLPSIDSLTAGSDFRAFLQQGVPDSVRVAALRRMWTLDPEIRDFVSPALDYAHDFNAPGGAPGFGPLLANDDVKALLGRVLGEIPPVAEEAKPAPTVSPTDATLDPKPTDPADDPKPA